MERLLRWLRFNWMYFGRPPWDTGQTPPELQAFIRQNPPGRAIDLGCGTGTNLLALGQAGWQVTGVDFALKAVRAARYKLQKAHIPGEVRVGDITRLETVRSADGQGYQLVLDIGCYHSLAAAGRDAYRRNLEQILAPGGAYLLYAHFRPPDAQTPFGITPADVDAFSARLALESRQDSQDRRGHAATWLCFRKVKV